MNRREIDPFEQDIRALLAHSLEGGPADLHLDDEVLILMAAGGLPDKARAGVDAHLVFCRRCASRLAELRRELRNDEQSLAASSPLLGPPGGRVHDSIRLPHQVWWRRKHVRGTSRTACRICSERGWRFKPAWLLAAAAIVAIGLLAAWRAGALEFGMRPAPDAGPETTELLQPRGSAEEPVGIAAPLIELELPRMIDDLGRFDGYPAWRAIAYGIGLLNRYGVPLESPLLSFEATTIYVVRRGETWPEIAATTLGDEALWPVLVLLNEEWVTDRELSEGAVVRIPLAAVEDEVAP